MADCGCQAGVAVDLHVVGRIRECGIDACLLANHVSQEHCIAPVAAADPVLAELPDVSRPGEVP
jgi:hypothetical protein